MPTILLKKSDTASAVPTTANLTNLAGGVEVAVNTADKRMFTMTSASAVVELGTNPSSLTLTGGTANGVLYLNASKAVTSGSALTFNGSNLSVASGNLFVPSGVVTIGDTTSGKYLEVYNGTADAQRIKLSMSGTDGVFQVTRSSGTTPNFIFQQDSTELMRLTSTGLGIGTSSPGVKLDVVGDARFGSGSTTNAYVARFYNQNSNLYIGVDNAAGSNTGVAYNTYFLGLNAYPMTFYTNSTERLRITSDGNLGLGVTPSAWGSNYRALQVRDSSNLHGVLTSGDGATSVGSNYYYNGTNNIYVSSWFATKYQQLSGVHSWHTAPSGTAGNAASFTQTMTLDASGNLGVGTTSPSGKIACSVASSGTFQNAYVASNGVDSDFLVRIKTNVTEIGNSGGVGVLAFAAGGGAERARIDASGQLALGTSTASSTLGRNLTINGANAGTNSGIVLQSATTERGYVYASDTQMVLGSSTSIPVLMVTGGSERARIDASGNLGLGVTPSAWSSAFGPVIQVKTGSGGGALTGSSTDNFRMFANTFYDGAYKRIGAGYATQYEQAAGTHAWYTAATSTANSSISFTQAMTLNASGQLSVGTTSASFRLRVASPDNSGATVISRFESANEVQAVQIRFASVLGDGGDFTTGTSSNHNAIFATNSVERARISTAGGFSVGTTADPGAGAIYATGNITAYYSDARLKDFKGKIGDALHKLSQLNGYYYTENAKAEEFGYNNKAMQVGVSAQEVKAVLPEVVSAAPFDLDKDGNSKSGDNYMTVNYEKLVPLLIEAIKELKAEVDALKGK